MMNLILGFGNKARQGKDSAAAVVTEWAFAKNIPVKRVAFADFLRKEVTQAVEDAGGLDMLLAKGPEPGIVIPSWVVLDKNPDMSDPLLPHGKHPKLLQWWGTEFRREQNPNYWVDKWRADAVGFSGIVVSPDTRFSNEAIAVVENGGYTINIRRLNEDGTQYFAADRPFDHPSEMALDSWNWDYRIIAKSGELDWLKTQVLGLVRNLISKG
jgi:hypothetical protein